MTIAPLALRHRFLPEENASKPLPGPRIARPNHNLPATEWLRGYLMCSRPGRRSSARFAANVPCRVRVGGEVDLIEVSLLMREPVVLRQRVLRSRRSWMMSSLASIRLPRKPILQRAAFQGISGNAQFSSGSANIPGRVFRTTATFCKRLFSLTHLMAIHFEASTAHGEQRRIYLA